MNVTTPFISILIPCYNEEPNIAWHHSKLTSFLEKSTYRYEIIYIDDGSRDNTLALIKGIVRDDNHSRYLSFSRNFGKEAAITAGMRAAHGDAVITIDADGQHPIELLDKFVTLWREGNDVVVGVRVANQGEGFIKAAGSKLFYKSLRLLDNSKNLVTATTDFSLIDRRVIDEYNKLTERNRVTRNLIEWLGFKRTYISFKANSRHAGTAAYSFRKLMKLALNGAVSHSTRPLKFIGALGTFISIASFLAVSCLMLEQYILSDPLHLAISGTAILALFLSFMIGIVLVCQGLLALYLENVYHETQNRPLYIIREET